MLVCLDPEKHRLAQAEFLQLEKQGIVRRSNSPWASPLYMVPKKNGGWLPVAVTAASTPSQLLTPILYLTCTISQINSITAPFFPPLTLSKAIIRSLSLLLTSLKLP
jgi:hypothetical protein